MTIAEMHIAFRQYAQQMGMQNTRAILPEQIDILLNQSITDTVNQLIKDNIGITNDRYVTDNSKIGQINAFRTLYKIKKVGITVSNGNNALFTYNTSDRLKGLIKHSSLNPKDGGKDALFGDYMFLVDLSINYSTTYTVDGTSEGAVTPWYPVRIIDSAYLADTLNDHVLKSRFRSPVACIYKDNTIELYIEKFVAGNDPKVKVNSGGIDINLIPNALRIDLIKSPNEVRYVDDVVEGQSVDCDLPESMHGDIVKHAVDMFRIAVDGSLQTVRDNEQAQQRESERNNRRNENNRQ